MATTITRLHRNGLLFWSVIKDKVFSRKSRTVDGMSQFIREACQEIDSNKDLCAKVCLSVGTRL
jgi:hypothetical protein